MFAVTDGAWFVMSMVSLIFMFGVLYPILRLSNLSSNTSRGALMSQSNDEREFTAQVIGLFERELRVENTERGRVEIVDCEGDPVVHCKTVDDALVVLKLLDWALDHYPFTHADDSSLVSRGGIDGPYEERQ